MTGPAGRLLLRLHQTSPRRFEPDANLEALRASLLQAPADLHVAPELATSGYDLGRRAREFSVAPRDWAPLLDAVGGTHATLALGFPLEESDGRLYNAAAVIRDGDRAPLLLHRKIHLPTYGTFDEGRIFAPGRRAPEVVTIQGWRVALLICEDLWHPITAWFAALRGADLLCVLAAPAGRGLETPDPDATFASSERWVSLARAVAMQHGVAVAVCIRSGVEGGLVFAGGSFVVGPEGDVRARAGALSEESFTVELSREEVLRARRPFSHLRDTDPAWIRAELDRWLRRDRTSS